ncbi:MAG: glucose-1-phosphate adenylyltransferase family protein [Dehalococcoidia bacterium]
MNRVLALILAGGQGDRLSILSEERAKPAVIFGGKYRIIDFVLSNCVNSGLDRVGVLTQYRPRSLNDHIGIGRPWHLDREGSGVSLLQPYLGRESSDWYSGTADAVYQNLYFIEEEARADQVLILAGDHVYLTIYGGLLDFHRQSGADVTVPVYNVPLRDASRYGILSLDANGRVVQFEEKPAAPKSTLASTGIYVFNKDFLRRCLEEDAPRESTHDFGRDILPWAIDQGRVFGYELKGYWRDVGTVDAYWQANMDLLVDVPDLDLYNPETAVWTRHYNLPPAKIGARAHIARSLLNAGDILHGHVEHSVISPNVTIEDGAIVRDSIIFDDCRIERGAVVDRAILDKAVHVAEGCVIGAGDDFTPNRDRPDILTSGISIVGKGAHLPPGLQVGRNCIIGPKARPDDFTTLVIGSGWDTRHHPPAPEPSR